MTATFLCSLGLCLIFLNNIIRRAISLRQLSFFCLVKPVGPRRMTNVRRVRRVGSTYMMFVFVWRWRSVTSSWTWSPTSHGQSWTTRCDLARSTTSSSSACWFTSLQGDNSATKRRTSGPSSSVWNELVSDAGCVCLSLCRRRTLAGTTTTSNDKLTYTNSSTSI